jgi:hypothetical protein
VFDVTDQTTVAAPTSTPLEIGRNAYGNRYFTGYMDEIRISDTARYTTTFTPSTTAFTADSNTKLLIHSAWDGGIGADSSGNDNDFTPTNLVATDQMVDSPTNNWCTLNPLWNPGTTFSEGNLKGAYSSNDGGWEGTTGASSGKWYWEVRPESGTGTAVIGIVNDTVPMTTDRSSNAGTYGIQNASGTYAYRRENGTTAETAGFPNPVSTDIINCALDLTNSKLYLGINGTYYNQSGSTGDPAAGTNETFSSIASGTWFPFGEFRGTSQTTISNFGQDSSFAGNETAQGNQDSNGIGDFYYEPPANFLALCSSNLASPEIVPTDHFETVLWAGDGEDTKAIAASDFVMDFAWIKNRDGDANNHVLYDRVRGTGMRLVSNATNAEADLTSYGNEVEFTAPGINVGSTNSGYEEEVNKSGVNYVGWNWKAGGATTVTNTDGDEQSEVSVNNTAGISILTYSGTLTSSGSRTVGHGMNVKPELIISKSTNTVASWAVQAPNALTSSSYILRLDTDAAESDKSGNGTLSAPSSSVFYTNWTDGLNADGRDFIALCFHSIPGYSKVGSYTANNSATDNAFVYTGFEPAWLMVKCINGGAQFWTIWDNARNPYNTANKVLHPNDNRAETTSAHDMDFYSNGFKPYNNSGPGGGGSTWQYLYYAVAKSPFKTSNAR